MKRMLSILIAMLFFGLFSQGQTSTTAVGNNPVNFLSTTEMNGINGGDVVATNLNTTPSVNLVGNVYYIRYSGGENWGSPDNVNALTAVFGPFTTTNFVAAVPATIFSAATGFVFMEGGNGGANELNTFLTANIIQIQNWVAAGGRLYIKAAPNVGGNINLGFGGAVLNYSAGPYSSTATATIPGHPIFVGPPAVTTNYTGNFYAHGILSGGTFTNIMNGNAPGCVLGGQTWGAGYVMFSTGTLVGSPGQQPAADAQNLLQNILSYVGNVIICTPPAITCPGNISVNNTPGQCGANVTYPAATATGSPAPTITYSHASGSFFPVGTTTVTATATNPCGAPTCTFNVTVVDNQFPVITCPFNITVNNDPGICGAVVNYNQPSATDNCGTGGIPTSIPGYTYKGTFGSHTYFVSDGTAVPEVAHAAAIALGGHLVTISSAAENAFVSAMRPETMWIGYTDRAVEGTYKWITNEPVTYTNWAAGEPNDYPNPGIPHEEDWAVINWTGGGTWNDWFYNISTYYVVEFEGGTIPTTLISGGASGSVFPVGTTTVTYQATDASGNTSTCSFTVTVVDNQPPVITCPANITQNNDPNLCSAVVNYTVTATDNCSTAGTQTFNFTGAMQTWTVPAGVTSVNISASGAQGSNAQLIGFPMGIGGKGGVASGTLSVTPGQVLNIFVGGAGTTSDGSSITGGGYNGGGNARGASASNTRGGGGGASDVRAGGIALANRVLVAGGGGGACGTSTYSGGNGGGLTGGTNGAEPGGGGTQASGGAAFLYGGIPGGTNGSFGLGGSALAPYTTAGAGGGWYGGGAGCGGGGGSSYIGGVTGGATTAGVNSGNGQVVITYNSAPAIVSTPASGSVFPVGTTTVTNVAIDAAGNSSTCSFTVTVNDNQKPTITCPPNVTVNNTTGFCANNNVVLGTPTATDNCPPPYTFTNNHPSPIYPVGTTVVTWTVADAHGNTQTCTQTVTVVDNEKPVITNCAANKTSATDAGLCTKTYTLADIGFTTASDNCSAIVTWSRSDAAPNLADPFPFGITTITWTATDPAGLTATCTQTININLVTTTTSVTVTPNTQQYSDKVTFVATVMPNNCAGAGPIGGTVTFKIGTLVMGTAPVLADGTATLPNVALLEPSLDPASPPNGPLKPGAKTVTAEYSGTDPDYIVSNPTTSLTITCEDARAYYTGACYASTASPTSSNATVTLSATIKDISSTPDAAGDVSSGDIRNATVTFINITNNSPYTYTTIATVPVGLVNPGDLTVGTATYNWSTTITGDAQNFTIGIIVNNYYCRNNSDDNTVVTVAKPLGDLFITGGGYLVLTNSAGIKAGTAGTKNNFGFNVKYNRSRTNLQGNINTIVRRMEGGVMRVYQIKGNVMTSLVVNVDCPKTAIFNGKANIKDITDPLAPISVDGNATLQVKMTDMGEPGSADLIAITLWDKNGGLWFASNWNGTETIKQVLGGGNLKVHGGASCEETFTRTAEAMPTPPENLNTESVSSSFKVIAYPNPSASNFTLALKGGTNEKVRIVVYDVLGIQVKMFERTAVKSVIIFGDDLKQGTYMVEVTQGTNKNIIKLIKQ